MEAREGRGDGAGKGVKGEIEVDKVCEVGADAGEDGARETNHGRVTAGEDERCEGGQAAH